MVLVMGPLCRIEALSQRESRLWKTHEITVNMILPSPYSVDEDEEQDICYEYYNQHQHFQICNKSVSYIHGSEI